MTEDIAVAHWGEYVNGGGERVGWELARSLNSDLYVSHRTPEIEPEDVTVHELDASALWRACLKAGDPLRAAAHQAIWQAPEELQAADILVTSGNEPLAYVPPNNQPWIAYIHHTSRQATDQYGSVINDVTGRLQSLRRLPQMAFRWTERQVYGRYAQKPTLLVANSEPVARRIETYWGVPSEDIRVLYPPVPTENFDERHSATGEDAYYLTLSRLDWHKNIDEIVAAFNELGSEYQLVVSGDGSERDHLEDMADDNITFTGYVPESEKQELLADARAFVFAAQSEDFGIAPVEAMAAGTPVIGVNEGFTQHQILDGQNGYTYDRDHYVLVDTIREFDRDGVAWTPQDIAEFARLNFGIKRFRQDLQGLLAEARDRHSLDVDLQHPIPDTDSVEPRAVTDGSGGDSL